MLIIYTENPEIKPTILKHPRLEKTKYVHLSKAPEKLYDYAHYIIQGRWTEAEPIIQQSPK